MERQIKTVQVDGLVLLKIIKHCEEELVQNLDVVNGVLLGLSTNDTLEVTHCFPLPKAPEEAEAAEHFFQLLSQYQSQMIRQLRDVNVDYMEVGLYQSSHSGAFLNRISFENLFTYHRNLNESIMLVFDSSKVSRGQIALRAFQLTKPMRSILAQTYNEDLTETTLENDPMKFATVDITEMCVEIPVVIRNSHLINSLIGTLDEKIPKTEKSFASLDLGVGNNMETHLKQMMDSIDTLCQHIQAHVMYAKVTNRGIKDSQRLANLPSRLDTSLQAAEIVQYCQDLSEMTGQTIGKLKLAKGVHEYLEEDDQ